MNGVYKNQSARVDGAGASVSALDWRPRGSAAAGAFNKASRDFDVVAMRREQVMLSHNKGSIKQTAHPKLMLLGPRFQGIDPYALYGIGSAQAYAINTDTLIGALESDLAIHSWMAELSTGIAGGSVEDIVFTVQTNTPTIEMLADPATRNDPVMRAWYDQHAGILDLAERLYGAADTQPARAYNISKAAAVFAQSQISDFFHKYHPGRAMSVRTALYNRDEKSLSWVTDANAGLFGHPAQNPYQAGFDARRDALCAIAEGGHQKAAITSCMDARAHMAHVFFNNTEVLAGSTMGGLLPPFGSSLAMRSWVPKLYATMKKYPVDTLEFLGHTDCAGAKVLSDIINPGPLTAPWRKLYLDTLLPLADRLYGPSEGNPEMRQIILQRTIPVYMYKQFKEFASTLFPDRPIEVLSYLYHLNSKNFSQVNEHGSIVRLTDSGIQPKGEAVIAALRADQSAGLQHHGGRRTKPLFQGSNCDCCH